MTYNLSQVINEGFVKGWMPLEIGSLLVMTVGWVGGDGGYWGSILRDTLRELRFWTESPHLCELFSMNSPETCWIDENGSGISGWTDGLIKSNQIKPNHIPNTKAHATLSTTSLEDQLGIFLRACIELLRWDAPIGLVDPKPVMGWNLSPLFWGKKTPVIYHLFSDHLDPGLRNPPHLQLDPGRFSLGQVRKKAF